jgi:hypothetical protein
MKLIGIIEIEAVRQHDIFFLCFFWHYFGRFCIGALKPSLPPSTTSHLTPVATYHDKSGPYRADWHKIGTSLFRGTVDLAHADGGRQSRQTSTRSRFRATANGHGYGQILSDSSRQSCRTGKIPLGLSITESPHEVDLGVGSTLPTAPDISPRKSLRFSTKKDPILRRSLQITQKP